MARYLAWQLKDQPYFSGQKLLEDHQIHSILQELLLTPKQYNIFATIQEYDKEGTILSCPIYADFDGLTAQEDAKDFCIKVMDELNMNPRIFYSGKKGFHVIVDFRINDSRCHHLVHYIMDQFGSWPSMDRQVYTSRRLFRLPNTYNVGGGCYKVNLTYEELSLLSIDDIRECARNPSTRIIPREEPSDKGKAWLDWLVSNAKKELDKPKLERKYDGLNEGQWQDNMYPCLRTMLDTAPEKGYTNITVMALAKFFKFYGVDLHETIGLFMARNHWKIIEDNDKDVIKVIKSVFKSSECSKPGCMYGSNKIIMKQFCNVLCPKNPEVLF